MIRRFPAGYPALIRAVLVLCLSVAFAIGGSATPPSQAQSLIPTGEWTTFANGDDVLALRFEGAVLWAGTRAGGLVRWDSTSGTYRQFLRPQDPLAGNTVHDIAIDASGRKWLATDGGLTVYDDAGTVEPEDDRWHSYTVENTAGGLPSEEVRAVAVQGEFVWVGGVQHQDIVGKDWLGGGLGRLDTAGTFDPADDRWDAVTRFEDTYDRAPNGSERIGLVSDSINDIAVTEEGNLWLATDPHMRPAAAPDPDDPPIWSQMHGGISFLDTKGTPSDTQDDVWTGTSCQNMQLTVTCSVLALAVDHFGFGWATIQGRGVMYFDAARGIITDDLNRRVSLPERPIGDVVKTIAFGPPEDPRLRNTVWLGNSLSGLAVLDHRGTIPLRGDDIWNFDRGRGFTTSDGLGSNRIQAVALRAGEAYLGTGPEFGVAMGVQRLDTADLTLSAPLVTDRAPSTNFITDIAMGSAESRWAGHVWIGTGSRSQQRLGAGVIALDTSGTATSADDQWTSYSRLSTDADGASPWSGLSGDNVQAIAIRGDQVWIGSSESIWNQGRKAYDDGGLSVFDGTAWTARSVLSTGGSENGLRFPGVTSLALGCEDDLWVGTGSRWEALGDGVAVLTPGASIHRITQDAWAYHRYPDLASNNISAISIDCARREVWVASQHHRTLPDAMGSPGGLLIGGGVARYELDEARYTISDSRHGLETYRQNLLRAEAVSVLAVGDGRALVGTYGTGETSETQLVREGPYWPAVLNLGADSSWTNQILERGGELSSIAIDGQGRLWAGTSRGGAARDSLAPEGWRSDRGIAGAHVFDSVDLSAPPQALVPEQSGIASTDVSTIAVAPWDGEEVWIGTQGWGIMRYRANGQSPTATPVQPLPATPTPQFPNATPTPGVATMTRTPWPATSTREPTPTLFIDDDRPVDIYLPFLAQNPFGI